MQIHIKNYYEQYFCLFWNTFKMYLKIFCCTSLCTAKMLLAKTSKFYHRDFFYHYSSLMYYVILPESLQGKACWQTNVSFALVFFHQ